MARDRPKPASNVFATNFVFMVLLSDESCDPHDNSHKRLFRLSIRPRPAADWPGASVSHALSGFCHSEHKDLPGVIRVREAAEDRLANGMSLAANGDAFVEVGCGERFERGEEHHPAVFHD